MRMEVTGASVLAAILSLAGTPQHEAPQTAGRNFRANAFKPGAANAPRLR